VPVVRVAPACSSASTTLASHAFMLVLRAVKERGMWLSGCTTGGEDIACICTLPCRAGETLSSMHARSTRDMLWLPPCAHAAAQQGAFGERTETSGERRTSKRRGRRRPPDEHAERASAGVERAAARLPHLVLACRAVHSYIQRRSLRHSPLGAAPNGKLCPLRHAGRPSPVP
jgi:hypothetical protein